MLADPAAVADQELDHFVVRAELLQTRLEARSEGVVRRALPPTRIDPRAPPGTRCVAGAGFSMLPRTGDDEPLAAAPSRQLLDERGRDRDPAASALGLRLAELRPDTELRRAEGFNVLVHGRQVSR
ncbi:MAG: hypothetical protein AAGA48_10220 [Myxococcota bacterium]